MNDEEGDDGLMQEEHEEQEEDLGIQEINDDDESQDIFDDFEKNQIKNHQERNFKYITSKGTAPIRKNASNARLPTKMSSSDQMVGRPSSAQPNASTALSKQPQSGQNLPAQARQQHPQNKFGMYRHDSFKSMQQNELYKVNK